MSERKKIVYIGGYGRSGSSLLGLILGQHESVFNAGAPGQIAWVWEHENSCTCGAALAECPVWSEAVTASLDARGSLRNCKSNDLSYMTTMMNRLECAVPESFVVDGSKSSRRHWRRPCHYRRLGYEVYFLHLIRHPSSVIASAFKGRNSDLERGEDAAGVRFGEGWITLGSWFISNLFAAWTARFCSSRAETVYFEELMRDPKALLTRIGELLDLDFHSVSERVCGGHRLETGHELAGNRMLRLSDVVFQSAASLKSARLSGAIGYVSRALGRVFRYD